MLRSKRKIFERWANTTFTYVRCLETKGIRTLSKHHSHRRVCSQRSNTFRFDRNTGGDTYLFSEFRETEWRNGHYVPILFIFRQKIISDRNNSTESEIFCQPIRKRRAGYVAPEPAYFYTAISIALTIHSPHAIRISNNITANNK